MTLFPSFMDAMIYRDDNRSTQYMYTDFYNLHYAINNRNCYLFTKRVCWWLVFVRITEICVFLYQTFEATIKLMFKMVIYWLNRVKTLIIKFLICIPNCQSPNIICRIKFGSDVRREFYFNSSTSQPISLKCRSEIISTNRSVI